MQSSGFTYSCRPNTYTRYQGLVQEIRALQHIDSSKTVIMINLIDISMSRTARTKKLVQDYLFICECKGCKEPDDTIWQESDALRKQLEDLLEGMQQQDISRTAFAEKEDTIFRITDQTMILLKQIYGDFNYITSLFLFKVIHKIYLTRDKEWNRTKINHYIALLRQVNDGDAWNIRCTVSRI